MVQKRAGTPKTGSAAKRTKIAKNGSTPASESKGTRDWYPSTSAEASPATKSEKGRAQSSKQETDVLLKWIESAEQAGRDAFRIRHPGPGSKKGKANAGLFQTVHIGTNNYTMDVEYLVDPHTKWTRLKEYKKFTVGGETHSVGDILLVRHNETSNPSGHVDLKEQWKARVLEVRALSEYHVFLCVIWFESPEDLPGGRKRYHGKNELVVSNQMSIIDAMTVNGGINIRYWDDADENSKIPEEEEYFWRQIYEKNLIAGGGKGTGKVSELHKICFCEEPHNPDEKIIYCEACKNWLHTTCIAEDAVKRASKRTLKPEDETDETDNTSSEASTTDQNNLESSKSVKNQSRAKRKSKGRQLDGTNEDESAFVSFTAKVEAPDDGKPKITVEDMGVRKQWDEDVKCLICQTIID
ncbi:hypothetical protein MBLNU459_g7533t1 [Dothideomycetes sp. NU459]